MGDKKATTKKPAVIRDPKKEAILHENCVAIMNALQSAS